MLSVTEVLRIRIGEDVDRARHIVESSRSPVIFEERDDPELQRIRAEWSDERLAERLGDAPVEVRYYPNGRFDLDVPQQEMVSKMPIARFFDGLASGDGPEFYCSLNRNTGPALFDDVRRLNESLTCIRGSGRPLNTVWIGGAKNVTPLHYDPVARLHGVIRGQKQFVLFPPDLRHLRLLQARGWRTGRRRFSEFGLGPLDTERFPSLGRARGMRALLGPGDFLLMPLCWWHHVSIPSETTITVSGGWLPRNRLRSWAYLRLRVGNRLFVPEGY